MIAIDVARAVRTNLVQHLDDAASAIEFTRRGMDEMVFGVTTGYIDGINSSAWLGRSLGHAADAERQLVALAPHGAIDRSVIEALESARMLTRRGDGAISGPLDEFFARARVEKGTAMPDLLPIDRALDARLDDIAARLRDVRSTIAARPT